MEISKFSSFFLLVLFQFFDFKSQILESERDAHLSAANQFADQLKLIQKKRSDFGLLPEPIKDYNDELGAEDYNERLDRTQYDGRKTHVQQRQKQPWRLMLLNYARGSHHNHKADPSNSNAKAMHNGLSAIGSSADDLVSLNAPRSQQQLMQSLYRGKQKKSSATTSTNADASESTNDLDWITSNAELNSATDYDALYDDVNENRSSSSSSSNLKFDRYRRNEPLAQGKEHLN